jgi:hypothetical protein
MSIKVAVLDDYQGISEPKFRALDPAKYAVSFFKDTLPPYNHPDTPQDFKDKLVARIEPFAVICMLSTSPSPPLRVHRSDSTFSETPTPPRIPR